jgi:hypothetical protein
MILSLLAALTLAGPAAAMNLARVETRTDLAAQIFNVTGHGVLVAPMDRGIDWRNDDFRNPDGTRRLGISPRAGTSRS